DRRAGKRDGEEVLLGFIDALLDGRRHFLGLAVAQADLAVAVADGDEGREGEPTAALHDLGHPVDGDDALFVAGATALVSFVRTQDLPPWLHRPAPPPGRDRGSR